MKTVRKVFQRGQKKREDGWEELRTVRERAEE